MNLNQAAHGDREFGLPADAHAPARARSSSATGRTRRSSDRIGAWMRAARALARLAGRQVRPLRRQHAPGRRDRGRQGRGRDAVRLRGQRLRRRRPCRRSRRRSGRRGRRPCAPSTRSATRSSPSCAAAARATSRCATRARIELGLRGVPRASGGFKGVHRHLRGPARPAAAARDSPSQRLMADGYGFGAEGDWKTCALCARDEGHGRRACPAAPRSWRTTPTTSRPDGPRSSARTCSRSARRSPPASRRCEIHPLGIGGKEDPVRLVFDAPPGRRSTPRWSTSATASACS